MGCFRVFGSPRVGGPFQPLPLAVDLDGALFKQPIALAIERAALRQHFPSAVTTMARHSNNRAFAAWLLALRFPTMTVDLDVNPDVLELMEVYGRFEAPVALITRMRREIAIGARNLLQLPKTFACLGAEGADNLTSDRKARLLSGYYGAHQFTYAGFGRPDAVSMAAKRSFLVGATPATKRSGFARGTPVVALSRHVDWRRKRVPAAQLIGVVDPVRDLTVSATVSRAIWDRESEVLPVVAAEHRTKFVHKPKKRSRGGQT